MSTIVEGRNKRALTNVGDGERVGSALLGGVLLIVGLRRNSALGRAASVVGSALIARGATGRCPVYQCLGREPESYRRAIRIVDAMQLNVSPQVAYAEWRDLTRLPRFMKHLESVTEADGITRWTARFPGLPRVSWQSEIVRDVPGKVLSWRSRPAVGEIENSGSVTFVDLGPRGTGLRVEIGYYPPAGAAGRTLARLFSSVSEQQVREDIRRFKRLVEAREIPTTEGQPRGANRGDGESR